MLRPSTAGVAAPAAAADRQLADKLVELGFLNLWQASQLLQGRTRFRLGHYRIVDSLGRGGMGQVFKAEHELLGSTVAVKVLPRNRSSPEAIACFLQEIRAQYSLNHGNLVRALDAGRDGNVYYLVTEYVPGCDLRKLVRGQGRMDMFSAARVICQAAAGLAHAHARGLVHRDVKPGNVLVTPDGHAKLSDLGLARPLVGDFQNDLRCGRIVGTLDYLSPDQIKDPWNPTCAWDIYSLGCTLYYAVTGKVPFPKGTIRDKIRAHCELRPLDPRRWNHALDEDFVELMADMMAKDPSRRVASAEEVIERLKPWSEPREREKSLHSSPAARRSESRSAGGSDDQLGLEDSAPSFPEISGLEPDRRQNSDQAFQATDRALGSDETLSAVCPENDAPRGAAEVLAPWAVLVLLPMGMVAMILLLWWAIERL